MSWRERINGGVGSFRDVPFKIISGVISGGRNTIIHEYPGRAPYPEDNGPAPDKITLSVVLLGDDYLEEAENLVKALTTPGPGVFYHPPLGRITVSALPYRRDENSQRSGGADFELEFIKWDDNKNPGQSVDTATQNSEQVDQAHLGSIEGFVEQFSILNSAGWVKDDAVSGIKSVLAELNTVVGAVLPSETLEFAQTLLNTTGNDVLSLISTPRKLAEQLTGSIIAIAGAGASYNQFFNVFDRIIDPATSTGTPNQLWANKNNKALKRFIKRCLMIELARILSGGTPFSRSDTSIPLPETLIELETTVFNSADDAIETLDNTLNRTDQLIDVETDNSAFIAVQSIAATLSNDIRLRAAQLPEIRHYTPIDNMPSLAVAYLIYGDTFRETEILERNIIEDPGFIRGGRSIEVLNA